MRFEEYFPGGEEGVVKHFNKMCEELIKDNPGKKYAMALLDLLRLRSEASRFHYLHSLRVAVVSALTAKMMYLNPVPAFFAGMLHDIGKAMISNELLDPPPGVWTPEMGKEMEKHVVYTHMLLREMFDFIDSIVVRHHRYQKRGYPKRLPALKQYSAPAEVAMLFYSVILSIADVYDAMHRITNENIPTGKKIKKKMISEYPVWSPMIEGMYNNGILSTWTENDNDGGLWTPPGLDSLPARKLQ